MQQTQSINGTLLVPTDPGIYRLNLYFSIGGGGNGLQSYFLTQLHGTDITGGSGEGLYCSDSAEVYWMPPIMVSLKPQEPLTYRVAASKVPTAGCQYNLAITVEQLM